MCMVTYLHVCIYVCASDVKVFVCFSVCIPQMSKRTKKNVGLNLYKLSLSECQQL